MTDNYEKIVSQNLHRLYTARPDDLAVRLSGVQNGRRFVFRAFGTTCELTPDGILLGGTQAPSVIGILVSLYALTAGLEPCVLSPLTSFKEFADSLPYVGAFTTHTEQPLVPWVTQIEAALPAITARLDGKPAPPEAGGDFSFTVYPLPKIALTYICYAADDDFDASITCLFSNNAGLFLPVAGLADLGEYTSKKILDIIAA
jgi:hypothetical protein